MVAKLGSRARATFGTRFGVLTVGVAVLVTLGVAAGVTEAGALSDAQNVHRKDREQMQTVLAGLAQQYVRFTALESLTASDGAWQLTPGSAVDRSRLQRFVQHSPLTQAGAAVVSLAGVPLTVYPSAAALPAPTDPGLAPVKDNLLHGQPGLSSVITVAGKPLVALGVPINDAAGAPRAVLVTFADARTWPLEGYVQKLGIGKTAHPMIIDGRGVVVASSAVADIGKPVTATPATRPAQAGKAGFATYRRGGTAYVASYAPVGLSGWSAVTEQHDTEFSGVLNASRTRNAVALLALLLAAIMGLIVLNHKRHAALRRLADEALYDPLTGLAQRRLFSVRYEAAMARHRRTGEPVAVLYCDLNRFKQVNDRLGHNRGDVLLRAVAQRLASTTREEEVVARLGGDEFAILLEGRGGADCQRVREVCDRIREVVAAPLELGPDTVVPSISVGAAVLAPGVVDADLVHAADLAMYEAKRTGQVVVDVITTAVAESRRPVPTSSR